MSSASIAPSPTETRGNLAEWAGCLAGPVGWFLQAQTGARTILLWWLATALVAAAVGLLLCQFGGQVMARIRDDGDRHERAP